MKDYSGIFDGLVTLNDGDRITGNCAFNGELTIAAGATVRFTGRFQKEINLKKTNED